MNDERGIAIEGVDHIQLAMPPGEEPLARMFYVGVLGMREVRKPRGLSRRGGAWFVGPGVAIHLRAEDAFRPARRAHPALIVRDLEGAFARLAARGVAVDWSAGSIPAMRCHLEDPFGNRIELVDARDAGFTGRQRPR